MRPPNPQARAPLCANGRSVTPDASRTLSVIYRALRPATYVRPMRRFVVAAREQSKPVRKDAVEASTAEHAIGKVATTLKDRKPGTIFEAWPKDEPHYVVKVTI